MGQLLRLHFEKKDHTFRILNKEPLTRETKEIDLFLDGEAHTIIKIGSSWFSKNPTGATSAGLVQAIAKAITLRFRI